MEIQEPGQVWDGNAESRDFGLEIQDAEGLGWKFRMQRDWAGNSGIRAGSAQTQTFPFCAFLPSVKPLIPPLFPFQGKMPFPSLTALLPHLKSAPPLPAPRTGVGVMLTQQ